MMIIHPVFLFFCGKIYFEGQGSYKLLGFFLVCFFKSFFGGGLGGFVHSVKERTCGEAGGLFFDVTR